MKKEYFVISNSDGDTTIEHLTKDELIEKLGNDEESNHWGAESFVENLSHNDDTNYWGNSILIIKGEIVIPKPKTVVKDYDIQ